MASRITIYGSPAQPDVRRLKREMSVMYVEYDLSDPRKDDPRRPPPPGGAWRGRHPPAR